MRDALEQRLRRIEERLEEQDRRQAFEDIGMKPDRDTNPFALRAVRESRREEQRRRRSRRR